MSSTRPAPHVLLCQPVWQVAARGRRRAIVMPSTMLFAVATTSGRTPRCSVAKSRPVRATTAPRRRRGARPSRRRRVRAAREEAGARRGRTRPRPGTAPRRTPAKRSFGMPPLLAQHARELAGDREDLLDAAEVDQRRARGRPARCRGRGGRSAPSGTPSWCARLLRVSESEPERAPVERALARDDLERVVASRRGGP